MEETIFIVYNKKWCSCKMGDSDSVAWGGPEILHF